MKIRSGFVSNSSSSSFICNNHSGYTLSQVKDILKKMFELTGHIERSKTNEDSKYIYFPKRFSKMFQEPFIVESANDKYCDMIWDWFESYEEHEKSNKENGFIDFDGDPFSSVGVKTKKDLVGKLIINSADDNTIPYSLFELIEETFNGRRIHLG